MLAPVMNELDAPGRSGSWRNRPAAQQPAYPDAAALEAVTSDLRSRPPLVFAGEVDSLREKMAQAAQGRAFVLMGGDCGDSVNEHAFTPAARVPDPARMLDAYLLYDTSAHLLWVGERTRGADDAHVALLEGVHNPVGVKVGPAATAAELIELIDHLNPEGEAGRLTLITRMGSERIGDVLPGLVEAVRADGRPVTWVVDPMHGNTITSDNGYKTRRFDTVMAEVRGFFEVHRALGTVPGGIHVELTGDDVTEVLGGGERIDEATLAERYETLVDPRLNHQQSLEMAFEVAEMLRA